MAAPEPATPSLAELAAEIRAEESRLRLGGGERAIERQHGKGRLTARERVERLVDPGTRTLELGIWAGWRMYDEYGGAPAAGLVVCLGTVSGRRHVIIANDATVKAGAFFPATTKKLLRAQRIAFANRLPITYLVDSSGVFLPLQEDIFPDEDDFGRIFRNNAVFSAAGLEQTAAVMGNCVAGGGYLPVLCDKLLMTEGSGLYLAGPALVKSAIGQVVSHEELGGAAMHAQVSGTIDYHEPDDESCLIRLRNLAALRPPDGEVAAPFHRVAAVEP
ncbi:MAG: acyl-CoA carboxylase subunit beta, partial [Planctomycetales bacterium]|nr:acyl-CoA carboxylase subunit beta [Planctomycetales bacterium]